MNDFQGGADFSLPSAFSRRSAARKPATCIIAANPTGRSHPEVHP